MTVTLTLEQSRQLSQAANPLSFAVDPASRRRDVLLGSEFKFEDRGRHALKGVDGEWPLFAVSD